MSCRTGHRNVFTACCILLLLPAVLFSQAAPYIGQTPPGNTPVKFAPAAAYVSDGSWAWRSAPVFSPAGNEMYFTKYFPNLNEHQIWFTKIENGQWTAPAKAPFSTNTFDGNPVFLQSNDTLYFYSQRKGGYIFKATRSAAGWSEPAALDIPMPRNAAGVTSFSMTKNKTIYLAIMDTTVSSPTIWTTADIYRTMLVNGQYTQPEKLGAAVNSTVGDVVGYVDPGERFLLFSSPRAGGTGWHDIYCSFRNPDGSWRTAVNIGTKINGDFEDDTPLISPDGKYFFFTTAKTGDRGYSPYWSSVNILSHLFTDTMHVTDYDGNSYRTVKIGNQIWMAENMRSTHYSDGKTIPHYVYNNDTSEIRVNGRLYSWAAAMKGAASSSKNPSGVQGIAPPGWHLPSKAEWDELLAYLGGINIAGGKMKSIDTKNWLSPNTGATNESGFGALPSGMHDFTNIFQWKGDHAAFSTSTWPLPNDYAVTAIMLVNNSEKATIGDFHPDDAYSVRCVKNSAGTGVKSENASPTGYHLRQNYPNPFNPVTTISYNVPAQVLVKMTITNLLGQAVADPVNEIKNAGQHSITFDAIGLSSGVYFCHLTAGNYRDVKRMTLVR